MADNKVTSYGPTLSTFSRTNSTLVDENYEISQLMAAHGIVNKRDGNKMYNKFSRIHAIDPYNAMTFTKEYVFFTKPDLHLMNVSSGKVSHALSKYAFFTDAIERYRLSCEQLQSTIDSKITASSNSMCPFMPLLSNAITSELDLPDIDAENEMETGANVYGTKISYRGNSYSSDQDCSFSVEFEDTKYLEVYMLFKIWDEYCRYKNLGLIDLDPDNNDDSTWINYTWKKIIHDQIAVYKFIVGEDGSTLVYWAKYTGAYPVNVPRSAFSNMNNTEGQKITVNFKAQFVRDMDPVILGDFNTVSLGVSRNNYSDRSMIPIFNENTHTFDGAWASVPYIGKVQPSQPSQLQRLTKYRLLWKT